MRGPSVTGQELGPLLRLCALECRNEAPLRALLSLLPLSRMNDAYLLERVQSWRDSGELSSGAHESLWPLQSLVLIAGLQWISQEPAGAQALLHAEFEEAPMIWASLRRSWRRSRCLAAHPGSLLLQGVGTLDWDSEALRRVAQDLRRSA